MEKTKVNYFIGVEYRVFQIDETTRIEYGFHLSDLGVSYQLQRLEKNCLFNFWSKKAWVYPSCMIPQPFTLDRLLGYLLWAEKQKNDKLKPVF